MSGSFEYIDIILLAMIAGFIILRLRGILGRRTGYEKKYLSISISTFLLASSKDKPCKSTFLIFVTTVFFLSK